jgi:hypothetical protein
MKSRRFIGLIILSGLAFPSPSLAKKPSIIPVKPFVCALKSGNIQSVVLGLNTNEHCAVQACFITQLQSVEIAGVSPLTWLWNGPQKSFTITEAVGFRADAKARALAAKPPGKNLIDITYFMTGVYNLQGSSEFLGARARYGLCGKKPDPKN